MDDDYGQRRRVAVALALTVILAPAAFLLNRSSGDDTPDEASAITLVGDVRIDGEAVGGDDTRDGTAGPGAPTATDPMGTTPIDVLIGTVPPIDDDPATIAIPRPGQVVRGIASFSRSISNPAVCQIKDLATIPFQSEITVTNLDNSRSVRCEVSVGGRADDYDVILNADAFLQIGDLTDAPLSVELTW